MKIDLRLWRGSAHRFEGNASAYRVAADIFDKIGVGGVGVTVHDHFLTDGKMKYIWRPRNGSEQLFILDEDPKEFNDLAGHESFAKQPGDWRRRLIECLQGGSECFVNENELVAGRRYSM